VIVQHGDQFVGEIDAPDSLGFGGNDFPVDAVNAALNNEILPISRKRAPRFAATAKRQSNAISTTWVLAGGRANAFRLQNFGQN